MLSKVAGEEELNDEFMEFKSGFGGLGEKLAPAWAGVESLKIDVSTYKDGKFEGGLALD